MEYLHARDLRLRRDERHIKKRQGKEMIWKIDKSKKKYIVEKDNSIVMAYDYHK